MSLVHFQTTLAKLLTDPDFLQGAKAEGEEFFGPGLSALERRRLAAIAWQRGTMVTGRLIRSFRLGKILTLLPLTCTLLGDDGLAAQAKAFWQVRPCDSFYSFGEALAFCRYLEEVAVSGDVPYLDEVVGYERAMLELTAANQTGEVLSRVVKFRHNPAVLLGSLAEGQHPTKVAEMFCELVATVDGRGTIAWSQG